MKLRVLAAYLALAQGCAGDTVIVGQNYASGIALPFDCASAAFCDAFDTASPGGNAGDLDDAEWSVARLDTVNVGQGQHNMAWPTVIEGCGAEMADVLAPHDFHHCASTGRLSMSYDSRSNHIVQAARIRRPFDFGDRMGVISFDVDGQSRIPGGHGYWWSVVIADEPVPAPYADAALSATQPRAGVLVEFSASLVCTPGGTAGGGDDLVDGVLVNAWNGVARIVRFENGSEVEVPLTGGRDTCFRTGAGLMNHIQIQLSRSSIEVFASDAETTELRSVALARGLELPFTRGYVSLEQVSQEADKCTFTRADCTDCDNPACPVMNTYHTYQWDNVGFDGPALPLPPSHPVASPSAPHAIGGANTGWLLFGEFQRSSFGIEPRGMSATGEPPREDPVSLENVSLEGVDGATLTMNAWLSAPGDAIGYRFNGGPWRSFTPAADRFDTALALAIPVDLADLREGTNTLEMSSSSGLTTVANIDLVFSPE
jgi:hypothetical protein